MKFMNEYDLHFASRRFAHQPRRSELVAIVDRLATWADQNSDGWAYWPKPVRAAASAIALIESRTNRENDEQERNDIDQASLVVVVRPIKAFLTRHGASQADRDFILRGE